MIHAYSMLISSRMQNHEDGCHSESSTPVAGRASYHCFQNSTALLSSAPSLPPPRSRICSVVTRVLHTLVPGYPRWRNCKKLLGTRKLHFPAEITILLALLQRRCASMVRTESYCPINAMILCAKRQPYTPLFSHKCYSTDLTSMKGCTLRSRLCCHICFYNDETHVCYSL